MRQRKSTSVYSRILLLRLTNRALLLGGGIVAELLVGRELGLLISLVRLALLCHALDHLDHLLHGGHLLLAGAGESNAVPSAPFTGTVTTVSVLGELLLSLNLVQSTHQNLRSQQP